MKKFIVAILAVIALAALTACSLQAVDSNTGGDGPAAVTIGKPAILLNGDNSVSWSAVSGATEYVVEVNGSEQPAQAEPGFAPITEAGTYQIRVKGVSGEYSGEWSNTVSYTVKEKAPAIEYFAKPVLTLNEDNSISWEAIEGATGYIASVNGEETEVFTGTTIPAYTETGAYAIKVKAVGEKQGKWSDEVTYEVKELLKLTEFEGPVSILRVNQKAYVESTTTASNPQNIYSYANGSVNVVPYVKLEWESGLTGNVTYTVEVSENEDFTAVKTIITDKKYARLYNLYNGRTYYYRVTAENDLGTSVSASSSFTTDNTAPRVINVDGVPNVRDIGGYLTESGKRTLQGKLYRGAEMNGAYPITEEGKRTMTEELGIKSDMDLRGNTGIAVSPLGEGVEITFYPIGNYLSAFSEANGQTELYRQIFSYLADESKYPVYFHCQGGADRTGTVAFLLNALLGVPLENLIEDQEFTSFSTVGVRMFYPPNGETSGLLMSLVYDKLMADYEGDTLSKKVENYMLSIGVTETEIYNLKAIMFGEPLKINVTAPTEVNVACQSALNLSVSALGNKTITSVVVGGENVEFSYDKGVISIAAEEISSFADGTVNGKVVFSDGIECEFSFIKKDVITVSAKVFNSVEDAVLTVEISDIGDKTVSKVIIGGGEVNFIYDLGKITVSATELEGIANGVVNGTIVLSNNRELSFTFSKVTVNTVLLTDYIAKGTKLDATNTSVTSAAAVGYGAKVKGLIKSEGATATLGGIDLRIGSYGFRMRGGELRVYQNGAEIARYTGLNIGSNAFENGNLYFTMWVEELNEATVRLHYTTATVDGSESENAVDYSYDFTVGASDVASGDAKFYIGITADVTSVTLLDDGGTGANIPKEYVTVNLTDYIAKGTKLDSAKTTVTSAEAIGYGVKVKMLLKTENVSHTGGRTIISIGSYGFELRGGELRIFRDGTEEKRGVGLTLQSGVFNEGNMVATMWVDIVDAATARLNLVTTTLDGSESANAVERYYDFEIKSTDIASENAKVTITIGAADVPSLTVLNEDGTPIEDEEADTPEEGNTVYLTDYVAAGTVIAVGSKASTTAIGFGTKIKMRLDADVAGSGGLLLSIGSYGFYNRGGSLRVYRDGKEEARDIPGLTLLQTAFNEGSLYITMWVEIVDASTARLYLVTETVDGSASENAVERSYDFAIKATDVPSENAVFNVSPIDSGVANLTVLADKAE